jgi:hypothetical protein
MFLARKFCYKNFILQSLFQSAQHFYEKRRGPGSGSVLVTNGSGCGSGRPKNIRIRIWNIIQKVTCILFAIGILQKADLKRLPVMHIQEKFTIFGELCFINF